MCRRPARPTSVLCHTRMTSVSRRRRPDDRGAVLVEAALVVPVVVALMFGMARTALGWHDELAVREAAESVVRAVSLRPSAAVDSSGLGGVGPAAVVADAVRGALASVPLEIVERVVVFAPSDPSAALADQVSPGCLHGPGPSGGEPCVVVNFDDPDASCPVGGCWWDQDPVPDRSAVAVIIRFRRRWGVPGIGGPEGQVAARGEREGAVHGSD